MLLLSNIHLDLEHPPSVVTFHLNLVFKKNMWIVNFQKNMQKLLDSKNTLKEMIQNICFNNWGLVLSKENMFNIYLIVLESDNYIITFFAEKTIRNAEDGK